MLKISLDEIYNHLKKNNFNPQMQDATKQVFCILHIAGKEFPLFFRICNDGFMLQLLAFLPCPLKQQTLSDVARLLHLINKELDVPGFGLDERNGVVFFRIMLPTPQKKLDNHLLDAFVQTIEQVCTNFSTPIIAVAVGAATLDEILAQTTQQAEVKK